MIEALGLPRVEVVRALAEDFHSATRFDTVVLSHVLEHVDDPEGLLRTAATHLGPGGRVIGVVPNAGSLHRRIGVRMGALTDIHDLTESDLAIGHRRVYDVETFRSAFESAGLTVEHLEGHFCKPLANSQLDALPDATQSALVDVGADLPPELCSEILIVASAG
jgi:2-polyprenyl-3-methyl-5-hydroxy-6-metoxy-1,4-benzoquinol methylase